MGDVYSETIPPRAWKAVGLNGGGDSVELWASKGKVVEKSNSIVRGVAEATNEVIVVFGVKSVVAKAAL
ncbi:hypothetical protein VD0002_g9240 [Verticillium dahliae]|nr:hypothetical protein VD0002_g9240 [Verticillium dahliae]